jgi:hypothetical protein
MPHVTVHKVAVNEIWLELGGKAMLQRVCTSMCDRSVTCLKSKELEEPIIIFRHIRVE